MRLFRNPLVKKSAWLCFAGTLVLSGCGGKSGDTAETGDKEKSAASGTARNDPYAGELDELLKKYNGNPNAQERGRSLLFRVCKKGRSYLVPGLIARGADVNVYSEPGHNDVLLYCSLYLDVETARVMLDHGATPLPEWTPLHLAVIRGQEAEVEKLLAQGCDVEAKDYFDHAPVYWAAASGNVKIMRLLMDKKADIYAEDGNYCNIMHFAAMSGNTEAINLLLEKGFSVNSVGKSGLTALHMAAVYGKLDAVRFLIAKGADPGARNDGGRTPLDWAVEGGDVETIKFLLENVPNSQGDPKWEAGMLKLSLRRGRVEALRYLLKRGFHADSTVLSDAVDNMPAVKLLLENGVDVTGATASGEIPLHAAAQEGATEAVRLFLEKGADVNAKGQGGETPLHRAAMYAHKETVRLLIAKGADVNAKDQYGQTPLDYAVERSGCGETKEEREGTIYLLKANGAARGRAGTEE